MNATKEQALKNLTEAGYAAAITKTGLDVRGEGWSVHYDDRGQDHNEYTGSVPSEVETLAVWDDATNARKHEHSQSSQRLHARHASPLGQEPVGWHDRRRKVGGDEVAPGKRQTQARRLALERQRSATGTSRR